MTCSIILYVISVIITFIIGFISVKKLNNSIYVKDLIFIIILSLTGLGFLVWLLGWIIFWMEGSDFGNKKLF